MFLGILLLGKKALLESCAFASAGYTLYLHTIGASFEEVCNFRTIVHFIPPLPSKPTARLAKQETRHIKFLIQNLRKALQNMGGGRMHIHMAKTTLGTQVGPVFVCQASIRRPRA